MTMEIARHTYEVLDDGRVRVDNPTPYKLTATSLAGVVGRSPWQTPYQVACRLLGVYREDISSKPSVRAGIDLEPVILQYARNNGLPTLKTAEELFGKKTGPHENWASDFEHPVFGGHVDGKLEDGTIIEVKTASDPTQWVDGVPEHYWLQASLYARMNGVENIIFLAGFLQPEDYVNHFKWKPEGNVYRYDVGVHPEIDSIMEYAEQWYHEYIENGITPAPETAEDYRLADILRVENGESTVEGMISDLASINDRMSELKKQSEAIKEQLRLRMQYLKQDTIQGYGYEAKLSHRSRTMVDSEALKRDGLYDKYSKASESITLTIKQIKQ